MKVYLEFDLDDNYEKNALNRVLSSTETYLCLNELDSLYRCIVKYENNGFLNKETFDKNPDLVIEVIEQVRSKLFDLLENYNINMDDLE